MTEFNEKQNRIQKFIADHKLDALLLQRIASFAWATCGQLHHQGGPAGYEPREWTATPTASDSVILGQAYAWNPSITGTKSEDTILVGAETNEVITSTADWQMIHVEVDGKSIARPAILEIT